MKLPKYPVYIPSKGRANKCLTATTLVSHNVPFRLVVEPQEHDLYAARYGEKNILTLPFSNKGSVIPARNWIKDHSVAEGHARHWQLDDNIQWFARVYRGKKVRCPGGVVLRVAEDFTDRYENIALTGIEYEMFIVVGSIKKPFLLNTRVYSCTLVLNSLPHRWRGRYNEDADLCLQVLADGWCTVLLRSFCIKKITTMTMRGGNTTELYQGDGRLKMARSLERVWPGVVKTSRRFSRPQHTVYKSWRMFDTPLRRRSDVDWDALPETNEYGLQLEETRPSRSEELRTFLNKPISTFGEDATFGDG